MLPKTKESEFAQFKRNSDFGPNMPPRWWTLFL